MAKLTLIDYNERIDSVSGDVEAARWTLARLASQAKAEGLTGWAEAMATNRHVRRKPRTVRDWALGWELRAALPVDYDLPLTFYTRAVRYLDRLSEEVIMKAFQIAVEDDDITAEDVSTYLSHAAKVDEAFSLADWLHSEYLKVQSAIDEAEADTDIEALQRLAEAVDTERSRLMQVKV